MKPGAYQAKKKNGELYFRSSITSKGRHISLGSYPTEAEASGAYKDACRILEKSSAKGSSVTIENFSRRIRHLSLEKAVVLLNYRDNGMYIKTPVYLRSGYFSYFLGGGRELKFDNDDLFYYSEHRILCHDGHLYVNDYGMQYGILTRFGIKSHAVAGKDFCFANGDESDFRYQNVIVINPYQGVSRIVTHDMVRYLTKVHINGEFIIGRFRTAVKAAVAYNKACDLAVSAGVEKNYIQNYITELTPREYAELYTSITMPEKYLKYLKNYRRD